MQILAVLGTILVASGLSGRQSAEQDTLLQMNEMYRLRQQAARQSLFGGWSTVTPAQFDGRCRCTGYKTYNPDQRVVCACTGAPGGDNKDLWRKGPWKILTGCMFSSVLSAILRLDTDATSPCLSAMAAVFFLASLHADLCVCVLTNPPLLLNPPSHFSASYF
jgi:type II secretory pathway pseudopilin PulG